jgi:hypothetical protein
MPTPAQVRAMPVTSVAVLRAALEAAGLVVEQGGSHLKVSTAWGAPLGALPLTPSDWRSLMNSRSLIARSITEINTSRRKASR